jgi:uncharacterized protein (DUF1778 family)
MAPFMLSAAMPRNMLQEGDMARRRLSRAAPTEARMAPATLKRKQLIRLSIEDQRRFADTIVNPPAPNKALRRAAKAYTALIAKSN